MFTYLANAQDRCTFCENGVINPSLVLTGGGIEQFVPFGDQTCAEVQIFTSKLASDDGLCELIKVQESACCPCPFCENGVTNPSLKVPEGGDQTCAEVQIFASELASDDDLCTSIKTEESACCPKISSTTSPTAASLASESPTAESVGSESESPTTASLASLSPTSKPPITPQPTFPPTNQVVTTSSPAASIISGVAFYDSNNNGNRESLQEYGVWDIKASLYFCGDDTTPLAQTSSSTQGAYQFENLAEGSYYINFEYPGYYLLGSVWNGNPSTQSVDNSVNPESGATNCFTLDDGDQFEADVAFIRNPNPDPPPTPPPTNGATPPPTLPVATPPPTVAATQASSVTATQSSSVMATQSPTAAAVTATSSPTTQSVSNTTMCAFCEGGIPDLLVAVSLFQTCGAMTEIAAEDIDGSDSCKIVQEKESVCCPSFTTTSTTSSPAPISNPCSFCEGGIPDEDLMPIQAGGNTCGQVKTLTVKESSDSVLCPILTQLESSCCPLPLPCLFCEDGMPEPDYEVFGTGQTCSAIKLLAANEGVETNICMAIQQMETSCCPASASPTTEVTTISPTNVPATQSPTAQLVSPTSSQPTLDPDFMSKVCTFCEDGMIDVDLEIPGRQGETCGSQKDRTNNLNALTPLCRTIQQAEDVCCPKPITNQCKFCEEEGIVNIALELPQSGGRTCGTVNALAPTMEQGSSLCTQLQKAAENICCRPPSAEFCTFCQEGIPDPSIVMNGGQSCGSMQAATASFPGDSELCSAAKAAESQCCSVLIEPVPSAPTNAPSTKPPAGNIGIPVTLLPLDVVGPITTSGIEMLLIGIEGTERVKVWQEKTAAFIKDYFKKNPGKVYDVDVSVTVFFETVTSIVEFTATRGGPVRRQLQQTLTPSVKIIYSQTATYKTKYPDSYAYDEDYIAEEPFKKDPEGYIAMLKRLSSHYDPVSEVRVAVPKPTPPPSPPIPALKSPEGSDNTSNNNTTYIIVGVVCGVVLIAVVAGILIVRKRKRRNDHDERAFLSEVVVQNDKGFVSRDMSDVFESGGAVAAAAALSSLPSGEVMVNVIAPEGKLGLVVDDPPQGGQAYVLDLKQYSPLLGKVHLGDKIIALDDDDVQQMSAADLSKLLARRSRNPQRKLTILRKGLESGGAVAATRGLGREPSAAARGLGREPSGRRVSQFIKQSDVFESGGAVAAAAALSSLPSGEVMVHVIAPEGKLGVVVDDPPHKGPAYVIDLREHSPLLGKVHIGDKIIALDDNDVQELSAVGLSKLLASKSRNPQRKLTILRKGGDRSSYEANNPLVAVSASQDTNSEYNATIIAPTGKLGFVVENSRGGGPAYVSEIREGSVLDGMIQLNDIIISIDGEDVRTLKAFHISKILASKSANKERKIEVSRGAMEASRNMFDDSSTFTDFTDIE